MFGKGTAENCFTSFAVEEELYCVYSKDMLDRILGSLLWLATYGSLSVVTSIFLDFSVTSVSQKYHL